MSLFSPSPNPNHLGTSWSHFLTCEERRRVCGSDMLKVEPWSSHAQGQGWGQEYGYRLSLGHALFPRVETRCLFQQLPWRTHPSRWGQLGKAATRPRWPEGASGAAARMGRRGEQDLARGSALSQAMVLVWGEGGRRGAVPSTPAQTAFDPCLQQKKELPVPEDHQAGVPAPHQPQPVFP